MAQQTTMRALGLHTSENELGSVPDGGNVRAENCILLAPGLVASRQGQPAQAYALPGDANEVFFFGDDPIWQVGAGTLARGDGSSAFTTIGSYTPPDADLLRMKAMEASENFYFNSTAGVYRLDQIASAPVLAGVQAAPDILTGAVNATAGFLLAQRAVGYRVVCGTRDAHDTLYLGSPGGRFVVENTHASLPYNVALTFPVPSWATTSYFWQLYRTRQNPPSEDASGATPPAYSFIPDPGDEMYLVQEAYFTSAQITAGTVSIVDTSPDQFLGDVRLYTNQVDGEGIGQANATPPFCKDLTQWNQVAWYANTRQRQALTLQILGCGPGADGYTGIRLGDTLAFGGSASGTYTAWPSEASGKYELVTAGDAGTNIEATARSLVNAINTQSNALRATYLSAANEAPGRILVESIALDDAEWRVSTRPRVFLSPVGAMSRTANVVTVETNGESNGMAVGDTVYFAGADPNFPSGTHTVTVIDNATTFRVSWSGGNATSANSYSVTRATPSPALAWTPPPPFAYFTIPVGGMVRTGGSTVTVTVDPTITVTDFFFPGAVVYIEPTASADANFPAGSKTVVTVGPGGQTFTYAETGSNATSTTAYQSGARVTSDPYRGISGPSFLSFSKYQQSEAVPLANSFAVGRRDTPILRIIGNGSNLLVFKPEGIYVVTYIGGAGVPYRADLLDSTVRLYAPDSVVNVSGRTFALTNQGVVAGTGSGFKIVSTPIEQELFQYFGPSLADVKVDTFGASHETQRFYMLSLPALDGATTAPYNARLAYVYSTIGNGWTLWPIARNCARVRESDDAFFLGNSTVAYLANNTKTAADYQDGSATLPVTSYSSGTLNVQSTTGITAGDAVVGTAAAIVTEVVSATALTVSTNPGAASTAGITITATINATGISASSGANVGASATALSNAINASGVAGIVTASPSAAVVTVTADTAGAAGNAITLTGSTFVTRSGATLTGGVDAVAATGLISCLLVTGPAGAGIEINGNGANVPFNTDNETTAQDLTDAINLFPLLYLVTAVRSGVQIALTATTPGAAGNAITLANNTGGVSIESAMSGGVDEAAASGTLTVAQPLSVTRYTAIANDLAWRTHTANAPADEKQYREAHLHFRQARFRKADLTLETLAGTMEVNAPSKTFEVYPSRSQQGPSSTVPDYTADEDVYPGMPVLPFKFRASGLPQNVQRTPYMNVGFSIREAFSVWSLNGLTLVYEKDSERS